MEKSPIGPAKKYCPTRLVMDFLWNSANGLVKPYTPSPQNLHKKIGRAVAIPPTDSCRQNAMIYQTTRLGNARLFRPPALSVAITIRHLARRVNTLHSFYKYAVFSHKPTKSFLRHVFWYPVHLLGVHRFRALQGIVWGRFWTVCGKTRAAQQKKALGACVPRACGAFVKNS